MAEQYLVMLDYNWAMLGRKLVRGLMMGLRSVETLFVVPTWLLLSCAEHFSEGLCCLRF